MGSRAYGWLIGLLAITALVLVGVYAYNVGVAHGLAESGKLAAFGHGGPVGGWWPGPWAFGFGFFPIWPLFFILFWFLVVRALFWRGPWHHRGWGGDVPPAFDEWHRRAHRQQGAPPASDSRA